VPPYDGLYRGELGGKQVLALVEATNADPPFFGRYAYLHVGQPIWIEGRIDGDAAKVVEGLEPDEAARPRWTGRFSPGRFEGEWSSAGGKRKAPIRLALEQRPARLTADGVDPKAVRLDDVFHHELARLNLVLDEHEVVAGGASYRMLRQTKTGVAYPQLTRYPDAEAMARTNALFERELLEAAAGALACSAGACPSCEDKESFQVTFFSEDFLSLSSEGNGSCGGRSSFWRHDKTYDLRASQPLDLLREFTLTTSSGQLRPKAAALMARHQDPHQGRPSLVGCSGDDVEPGAYRVEAWVAEAGLGVRTAMAEFGEESCDLHAVVPFAELEPFRRKGSRYAFGTR